MTNRTPFRPLNEIPARLLASDQLKWQQPESDQVIIFTTNGKHFGYEHSGVWFPASGGSRNRLVFRPIGLSWEAAADLVQPPVKLCIRQSQLPKNGDGITVASAVAVVKEGCRQAFDELLPSYEALSTPPTAGKGGSFSQPIHQPHRTVITALPPGRRKYVKLFLKGLGLRNVDEIPTTIEQKPYDLGRSFLSSENREKLTSLAPNIVLRDVL